MPSLCVGVASSWRSLFAAQSVRAFTSASCCQLKKRLVSRASCGLPTHSKLPPTFLTDRVWYSERPWATKQFLKASLQSSIKLPEGPSRGRFVGWEVPVPDRLTGTGLGPTDFTSQTISALSGRNYTTAMPTDAQIKAEALSIIRQAEKQPSLVVFDLDYTIWPFWCEVKTTRSEPRLYPEIRGIFEALAEAHVPMAIASRTPSPNIATVFLKKLQLTSMFGQQEIYPTISHKTEHFKALLRGTNVPYDEMLFFDDEDRNVDTISPLGVKCVLVEDGVNLNALKEGFAKFQS